MKLIKNTSPTKGLFDDQTPSSNLVLRYVNGNMMKVNTNNVLDQYFTKEIIALNLFEKARAVILHYEENIDDFHWIEPSAGNGVFFNLLPKNKRTGVDIHPLNSEIIESDYLDYNLPRDTKNIVIGNPPFGHRGVMALRFINHSKNADYVCFILPMFFESQGKGSIKYRIKGLNLIHSERLPKNSFYTPSNGKSVDVKCVFQIFSKNHKVNNEEFSWYKNRKNEPFPNLVKVFTVSLAKNRECGKRWIFDDKADFYLSSTFHDKVSVVDTFEEVKYKSGVAIVMTTEDQAVKERLKEVLKNADWKKYGSLATNSCYHIGKSNIFKLLQDNLDSIIQAS